MITTNHFALLHHALVAVMPPKPAPKKPMESEPPEDDAESSGEHDPVSMESGTKLTDALFYKELFARLSR